MSRFDRYLLSQLMVFFGFFSIVLVLVYWVNRAVVLFDWLIASGQSASVFLEFTALTLPNVIRIVLPISAFAAAVYAANRMTAESELVVVQATGYGPFRLARPVLVFGILVGAFVSLLVHFAIPSSFARLAEREVEVTENVAARLLTEGQFIHPEGGITVYIRDISGGGELRDVYLRDATDTKAPTTYTAARARLVRTDAGPRLIMYDGIAQELLLPARRLSVTRFETYGVDISAFLAGDSGAGERRSIRALSTPELLAADPEVAAEIGETQNEMRVEGHQRFSKAIMATLAPVLGFATLLIGGFSRFGVRKQIGASVGLVVLLTTLDNAMNDVANETDPGWFLIYIPPAVGGALAVALLWIAANPQVFRRQSTGAPAL
ncbi:MAG: LPS export ABC transporter permease LptF [Pseudomonadota bacterium]